MMKLNLDPSEKRSAYATATPFPHIALDGLFPDEVLEAALAEFPSPNDEGWNRFENSRERKLGYHAGLRLGPSIRGFMTAMSSPPLLDFLEKLTGIEGLIPDPYYGGGGPHQILSGGFLKIHSDFNWHPKLRLDRRLNVLVYLNKDWPEHYGGALELWDPEMKSCVSRIAPLFNRTVIFSTTDVSYHGHPLPLACPPERSRKSISFYYYTNGRPEEERTAPHDTIFRKRHDDDW